MKLTRDAAAGFTHCCTEGVSPSVWQWDGGHFLEMLTASNDSRYLEQCSSWFLSKGLCNLRLCLVKNSCLSASNVVTKLNKGIMVGKTHSEAHFYYFRSCLWHSLPETWGHQRMRIFLIGQTQHLHFHGVLFWIILIYLSILFIYSIIYLLVFYSPCFLSLTVLPPITSSYSNIFSLYLYLLFPHFKFYEIYSSVYSVLVNIVFLGSILFIDLIL